MIPPPPQRRFAAVTREHDERGPNGVRVDVDERLSGLCLRGLSLQELA